MNRSHAIGSLVGTTLALAIAVAPTAATHTNGTLDCGGAGTYEVDAASIQPLPKFEAPKPFGGLFLLEDTNQVFRATEIFTPRWSIVLEAADKNPHSTIECTLTSVGPNFEEPWELEGFLVP